MQWINLPTNLGISQKTFSDLYKKVKILIEMPRIKGSPRRCSMTTALRLYMILYIIRKYPQYSTLGENFKISGSTISRDLRHILPIIKSNLNFIKMPEIFPKKIFGCIAAIDCSAHMKQRSSPQYFYYNGYKVFHFFSFFNFFKKKKKKKRDTTVCILK